MTKRSEHGSIEADRPLGVEIWEHCPSYRSVELVIIRL